VRHDHSPAAVPLQTQRVERVTAGADACARQCRLCSDPVIGFCAVPPPTDAPLRIVSLQEVQVHVPLIANDLRRIEQRQREARLKKRALAMQPRVSLHGYAPSRR